VILSRPVRRADYTEGSVMRASCWQHFHRPVVTPTWSGRLSA
jgi:hypothetical protein